MATARKQDEFKKWLRSKGLTYEKFAYDVGISWSTVARWASGRVHPGPVYRMHIKRSYPDFPL